MMAVLVMCLLYLFADDTNIYYESDSIQDLEKTINKELHIDKIRFFSPL